MRVLVGRAVHLVHRFVWVLAGWLFLTGILLFSGSLYLLTLAGLRWMGAITPLGGVAFILGWVLLAVAGWRHNP